LESATLADILEVHVEAPAQITPTKLADYLEVLTKAVFESGMSWRVIENKWPGFQEAFQAFDPETVATLSPDEIDALTNDTRIIRNRKKIEATVHNAGTMLDIEREFGTFKKYLESHNGFDALLADMRKRFKFVGAFGAYYFLWVVREPVPPHDEFRAKLQGS
jgi:3-methyladenine DNA glycosylase Tag